MSSTTGMGGINISAAVAAAAGAGSAPAATMPDTKPKREAKAADKRGWWWGTGRRKTAVARVRLRPATDPAKATITLKGKIGKNKTVEQYFAEIRDRVDAVQALKVTGMEGRFEIAVQLHGGGFMGQAQAMRLGVARALLGYDPSLHGALREHGLLTRDSREVERKKYGKAGARRRFQFSKR